MEIDFRIPAVSAGAAFVLVVLTGAIAGVGFGALLLRAILGALAFAALGVGGEMVAKKFLPELYNTSAGVPEDVSGGGDSADGGTIDITLDEENPHRNLDADGAEGSGTTTVEDEDIGVGVSDTTEGSDGASINEMDAADVEELETIDEERAESDRSGQVTQPTVSKEQSETPRPDGLPSFDGVESAFDTTVVTETESATASAGIDVMGQEEDPETVARAVRTLLKRDEEG